MLKKLLSLSLCLLLLICSVCFVSCSKASVDEAEEYATVDNYKRYLNTVFNSTKDRADTQGYNNWYYYCGDPDNNDLELMGFNAFSGRWGSRYNELYYFCYIWDAWLDKNGQGIGMSFKAPATGTIKVTVDTTLAANPTYDTVTSTYFQVSYKKQKDCHWDALCYELNKTYRHVNRNASRRVNMGDEIMFILVASNYDAFTHVDITIQYTGA